MVPELARLERSIIFEKIAQSLWTTLIDAAAAKAGSAGLGGAPSKAGPAIPATKRALQEAAIKHWFLALDALARHLSDLGTGGHLAVLRSLALQHCLRRLDALLFHHLLTLPPSGKRMRPRASDLELTFPSSPVEAKVAAPTAEVAILSDYDPNGTLWGPRGSPVPTIDDSCLPFTRGALTFGSGMGVKMTVTRLQQVGIMCMGEYHRCGGCRSGRTCWFILAETASPSLAP